MYASTDTLEKYYLLYLSSSSKSTINMQYCIAVSIAQSRLLWRSPAIITGRAKASDGSAFSLETQFTSKSNRSLLRPAPSALSASPAPLSRHTSAEYTARQFSIFTSGAARSGSPVRAGGEPKPRLCASVCLHPAPSPRSPFTARIPLRLLQSLCAVYSARTFGALQSRTSSRALAPRNYAKRAYPVVAVLRVHICWRHHNPSISQKKCKNALRWDCDGSTRARERSSGSLSEEAMPLLVIEALLVLIFSYSYKCPARAARRAMFGGGAIAPLRERRMCTYTYFIRFFRNASEHSAADEPAMTFVLRPGSGGTEQQLRVLSRRFAMTREHIPKPILGNNADIISRNCDSALTAPDRRHVSFDRRCRTSSYQHCTSCRSRLPAGALSILCQ